MTPRSAAQRTHLHVELAVDGLAFSIHQLERVAAVAVHVPVAVGRAAVRGQERHLVSGLRPQADEVPEHVGVLWRGGGALEHCGVCHAYATTCMLHNCILEQNAVFLCVYIALLFAYLQVRLRVPFLSVNETRELKINKETHKMRSVLPS